MSVKYYNKELNKWVIFPGTLGVPGKDAYQVAQENGYTGTKEEYNAALVNVTNIDKKQDKLISGINIKTINNESLLGEGNIETPKTLVEDNLNSVNPKNALSANQGNVLKILVDTNTKDLNTKLSKTEAQNIYQPKGDYALSTALSQETNRAQEIENNLQEQATHLESEVETLKSKQTEAGQKIDSLDKEMGDVKGKLAKEIQRATSAEQANASAIQAINGSKGSANGIATLDSTGHVPASQLPSYVDDILSFSTKTAFPLQGEDGKIYVAKDSNLTYRWDGSGYVEISKSLALGETSSTAYPGNKGKQNADGLAAETMRATQAENAIGKRIDEEQRRAEAVEAELAGGGALRPLYEAMPDVAYNEATRFYEIAKADGGPTDVTEKEMAVAFQTTLYNGMVLSARTRAVIAPYVNSSNFVNVQIIYCIVNFIKAIGFNNAQINNNTSLYKIVGNLLFTKASNMSKNPKLTGGFTVSISNYTQTYTVNFGGCPLLGYDVWASIPKKYDGDKKGVTTVQVDATPYALLTGTATEEQYTATGHTKEEWMQIVADSTTKGITFTKAL